MQLQANPLTCAPAIFVGTYMSQGLVSVIWFSMDQGLPISMLGLVIFLWGHQSVSQAIDTMATFAQCTSHF